MDKEEDETTLLELRLRLNLEWEIFLRDPRVSGKLNDFLAWNPMWQLQEWVKLFFI